MSLKKGDYVKYDLSNNYFREWDLATMATHLWQLQGEVDPYNDEAEALLLSPRVLEVRVNTERLILATDVEAMQARLGVFSQ